MERTFEDSYRHATEGERRVGLWFWLAVLWDEVRSIVRERTAEPQGNFVFFALVLAWACAVLIVPVIPVAGDWHHLVVPTVVLAVMFLTVPGTSRFARRFATVLVVVAVFAFLNAAGQSVKDANDLLAPALLVACMAFSIKTLAGLNVRLAGMRDRVWGREELVYGVLVGLAGLLALAVSVSSPDDNNLIAPLLFVLVVPFLCGVAGFRASRRGRSLRTGVWVALGSMLIGAMIWILAEPLVAEGALLTLYRDHPVPAAALLVVYWQRPLSNYLFWAAMIGMVGAIFGHLATEAASQSPSQLDNG